MRLGQFLIAFTTALSFFLGGLAAAEDTKRPTAAPPQPGAGSTSNQAIPSNQGDRRAIPANSIPPKMPDLVVILTIPMSGTIVVKNIGMGPAGPSKLIIECTRWVNANPNTPLPCSWGYSPWNPPALVNVPSLSPGAVFTHTLDFWSSYKWTSGTYHFTAHADASKAVPESNEVNNTATSHLTVP